MENKYDNIINDNYINKGILCEIIQTNNKLSNNKDFLKFADFFIIWFKERFILKPIEEKYALDCIFTNEILYDPKFYKIDIHNIKNIDLINYEFKKIVTDNFRKNLISFYSKSEKVSNYLNKNKIKYDNLDNINEKTTNKLFYLLQKLTFYNYSTNKVKVLFDLIKNYTYLKTIDNELVFVKNQEERVFYQHELESVIDNYYKIKKEKDINNILTKIITQ